MRMDLVTLVQMLLGISIFLVTTSVLSDAHESRLMIIVNDQTSVNTISKRQLRKLFLGKSLKLPNGSRAILGTYAPLKNAFNKRALGRSSAQVDAAWSRLKFSGRAQQPSVFTTAEEVLRFVSATPNAIAYLPDSAPLSRGVRSIFQVSLK